MNLFAALFTVSLFFNSIDNCRPSADTIKSLRIESNLTDVTRTGDLLEIRNFFTIYYSGDLRMYQFRYAYDSVSGGQLIDSGFRSYWFVHQKGAAAGYSYTADNNPGFSGRMSVDSLLNKHA